MVKPPFIYWWIETEMNGPILLRSNGNPFSVLAFSSEKKAEAVAEVMVHALKQHVSVVEGAPEMLLSRTAKAHGDEVSHYALDVAADAFPPPHYRLKPNSIAWYWRLTLENLGGFIGSAPYRKNI